MTLLLNELTAITGERIHLARAHLSDVEMARAVEIQSQIGSLGAELDDILGSE
ncbi:hypothetical protein ACFOYW_16090 [Gryllotalpicola reticulitermitis]|uniref:Uncharacterized protein n=1 Tax=Gryllotalpicola reticulitermitis TaxID=1184153 RepID=A0ABV8QBI6_9MICO